MKFPGFRWRLPALLFALFLPVAAASANDAPRARLLVLTDIEADPDDTQSLVRLVLYANEIDIEGLVATTSIHQSTRVAPESIQRILDAYAKVQPNLALHMPGYPAAAALKAQVRSGMPVYGMEGVGEGKDSPGSDRIIERLEADDPRPLWVAAWGGANTLAQALYRLRASHHGDELQRLLGKLRVYAISDQDDSGAWIRQQFPELFYIVSPGGYGAATWGGIMHVEPGFDASEVSNAWIAEHIQQGHGPLGALYPDVAYGVEGDTPSFLQLIPNGLNEPDHPELGGWGGRYTLYVPRRADTDPDGFNGGVPVPQETRPIWTNAVDTYAPYEANVYGRSVRAASHSSTGFKTTLWRWRKAFQNDFAARMDWTTHPYDQANHPPVVVLAHPERLSVRAGERIALSARGSSDPDGDSLQYLWFHYPEASGGTTALALDSAENMDTVMFKAPKVGAPQEAQFIVQVTDRGTPALTRYRRVWVTIAP
jgi:hypothetical protein